MHSCIDISLILTWNLYCDFVNIVFIGINISFLYFFLLQIEKTVMFQTGCLNVTSQLAKLKKFQSRVILFSARFVPSIGERSGGLAEPRGATQPVLSPVSVM